MGRLSRHVQASIRTFEVRVTFKETERLIKLLKANGISHFKSLEVEIDFGSVSGSVVDSVDHSPNHARSRQLDKKVVPPQAAPPVEQHIPHHVNEVQQLLKLSDEDLVDRLFPDHTQSKDE